MIHCLEKYVYNKKNIFLQQSVTMDCKLRDYGLRGEHSHSRDTLPVHTTLTTLQQTLQLSHFD